jgi:two-component system chemotaxis sensor kinase CheA
MANPDCGETFRAEAQDLLDRLEQALLDLDQRPDDRELIHGAFRALHTIKGSGAMFGFEHVAAFTHGFETAFDRVRNGSAPASRELVAVALAAKDHIRTLIDRPEQADAAAGEAILADLAEVVGGGATVPADVVVEPAAAEARDDGEDAPAVWDVHFRLPQHAFVNGTNPLLMLDELRALGPCKVAALVDAVPALEEMQPDGCYLGWRVELATSAPRQAIEDVFVFVDGEAELRIEERNAPAAAPAPDGASPVAQAEPARAAAAPRSSSSERRDGPGRREADKAPATSLRVPAERLDELMDRVGELVIAQARLSQLTAAGADLQIKSVAEEIERLASALRDTTMGIRMVPIGSLFGRFRRLVHDLSRDLGKEIDLAMEGEDTELDKTMIERLADPLVHLIRNAADHGLETAAERAAAGKPAEGRVRLVARHAGAEVLVTIADDGRGLDRDRIRAKAEEQGLLAPGATVADADLFQFLFQAGFSTAREVSSLSGRGVGMDVVKRTIESLRGTIDIATQAGAGTEVTLRLPLTLAIIDGLLVRIGAGRYVIPLSAVEECVELSGDEDARSQHRSFMNIRGELVPFIRLRELFAAALPPDPYQKVVIVAAGEMRVGLVVDQIIGSHQTVIKSLSRLQAEVETFSGATILGDGTVALILDVAHLVEAGQAREGHAKCSRREAA